MFVIVEMYGGKLKKKNKGKNLTKMARNLKKKKEKGYTVKQMKKMGFPDYFSKHLKRKNLTRMARNLKKKKEKGYTVKQMKDMGFPDYFYN